MQRGSLRRIAFALLLLACCRSPATSGDEPEWVKKRPVVRESYVGIGMATKDRPAVEYTGQARNVALNDIASQITVSISSDVLRTVLEKNERLEEEFQSRIRASATAELEGVRIVDTYESEGEYWVYLELSRAGYATRREEKIAAAAGRSFDLFSRGRRSEREGDVRAALGFYAQAFGPIERYLAEPLVVEHDAESLYLVNEIYSALRSLLDRLEVVPTRTALEGKFGRPLARDLEVMAVLKGGAPAARLPFRFTFTRGSGECNTMVQTDAGGLARCRVQKITAPDRLQTVEAGLDLLTISGRDGTSPLVQTVLGTFALPTVRFTLTISGVDVFIDARESLFGEPLQQKRVEPAVKSALGASHFSFVDDRSKASLAVSIVADARKGGETRGLAFAFASGSISVVDTETGREIFKNSVTDVKAGSDTFEKAGYRSLEALAGRMAGELVPRIVEEVRR